MQHADWWRGAALYQIYPRSFQDSNGDGVGDLAGVSSVSTTSRASASTASGCRRSSRRRCATSATTSVTTATSIRLFGTLAEFDALVAKAHALGLKVIIDQVWSHTADEHPWFQESRASRDNPRADWYVWADAKPDGSPPNNWQSWMGGSALALGAAPPPIPPAQLPAADAGPELPLPGRAGRDPRSRATSGSSAASMASASTPPTCTSTIAGCATIPALPPGGRRLAGADAASSAQREPAGDTAVPRATAGAAGSLSGSHGSRRNRWRRKPAPHDRVHARPAPAAHRILVRVARRPARSCLRRDVPRTLGRGLHGRRTRMALVGNVESRRATRGLALGRGWRWFVRLRRHRDAGHRHRPGGPRRNAAPAPRPARRAAWHDLPLPGRRTRPAAERDRFRRPAGSLRQGALAPEQGPRWMPHANALGGRGASCRLHGRHAMAASRLRASRACGGCTGTGSGIDPCAHAHAACTASTACSAAARQLRRREGRRLAVDRAAPAPGRRPVAGLQSWRGLRGRCPHRRARAKQSWRCNRRRCRAPMSACHRTPPCLSRVAP